LAIAINTRSLWIFTEQCRIARSNDFAIIRDDQDTEIMNAGLSRSVTSEIVENRLRIACRRAKIQQKKRCN